MKKLKVLEFKNKNAYLVNIPSEELSGLQVLCDGKELFNRVFISFKGYY